MTDERRPPITTTDSGIPVASDEHSLTVGPKGPTVLHDSYVVQKMQHFNRERVPERVVHAKGGGAHGFFEVTGDVTPFTRASRLDRLPAATAALDDRVRYLIALRFLIAAITIVEPGTGLVKAMVQSKPYGGKKNQTSYNYNVEKSYPGGYGGFQNGSTMKAFTIAAARIWKVRPPSESRTRAPPSAPPGSRRNSIASARGTASAPSARACCSAAITSRASSTCAS